MSAVMLIVWLVATPATARADVVLDWNEIAARTVLAGQSPFNQARLMAITQLAVFEAVNAVTGDTNRISPTNYGASRHVGGSCGHRRRTHGPQDYFPLNTSIDTDRENALAAIPRRIGEDQRHGRWRSRRRGDDRASRQ